MVAEVVVEIDDLKKYYGETRAVDGVSFAVAAGEVFGMLGPNGAGKTTTIECIEGLREPDHGKITVLGMAHGSEPRAIKARIGVQLQTTGLFPKLTVQELLGMFCSFYPKSLPVDKLMSLVSLEDKRNTRSKDLSGGQKQRLSLALALVGDPDLVFLDEPTTGLDPQARRALWDVVKGFKAEGRTVILTTHYMEEAEELCDRVAIVDHGKIIEMDKPASLISRYFKEAAIEFAATRGWSLEKLSSLPGVRSAAAEDGTVAVYTDDVPRTMAALLEMATASGLSFVNMTVRTATLEDVFLRLTGRRLRE